jgi:hypothetical protein
MDIEKLFFIQEGKNSRITVFMGSVTGYRFACYRGHQWQVAGYKRNPVAGFRSN